ncbi:hypothetical protein ACQZV8_04240 [Magnetococcales bacterium HHB-1]
MAITVKCNECGEMIPLGTPKCPHCGTEYEQESTAYHIRLIIAAILFIALFAVLDAHGLIPDWMYLWFRDV